MKAFITKLLNRLIILLLISLSHSLFEPNVLRIFQNEDSGFYTAIIKLGEPPIEYEVQIDTMLSQIWVPSINNAYEIKPKYQSNLSISSKETSEIIKIQDEDGDIIGTEVKDTIIVGKLVLNNFSFIQADSFDSKKQFTDYPNGKIGLAFPESDKKNFNIIKELKNNKLIDRELVTFNPISNKLILGSIKKTDEISIEDIEYCNVTNMYNTNFEYKIKKFKNFWVCQLTHIYYGNENDKNLNASKEISSYVLFDSGHQYITIPNKYINTFFDNMKLKDKCRILKGKEKYFICNKEEEYNSSIVNVTFVIGGFGYVFGFKDLFKEYDNETFISNFRFVDDKNIFIFGKPFFEKNIIVFDYEENRMGFSGMFRKNYTEEWDLWIVGRTPEQLAKKMKILIIISAGFAGILIFIIVAIFIINSKKNDSEVKIKTYNQKKDEHGPLEEDEEGK